MNLIEIRMVSRVSEDLRMNSSEEIAEYCMGPPLELSTLAQEHLYCFCLSVKNDVNSVELISKGSLNTSIAAPREIMKAAVLSNAASIILVHNHPSGDVEPSLDDISLTQRIKKVCNLMGIRLIDHIIIGKKDYYSFNKKNMM
jgi:DNA repair protein RadC